MSNQLQVYQGLSFGELRPQDITTIRETIAKDCNESQFNLFMSVAKSSGANPLLNEIYPTVRQGQLTIQFGYDFYIRKAKESDGYLGYDVQLVHENDEVIVERKTDPDGRSYMVIKDHKITFPRGKVIAAYAIAFREGVTPFTVFMEVEEVEHLRKSNIGMQKTMWNNYFGDMFKKHVLKRALKGQFGLEFDDQTIDQDNSYEPRQRKDITPSQNVIEVSEHEEPQSEPEQSENEPVEDEETQIKKARAEMKKKFKQLGITDKEEMTKYIQEHCEIKGDKPTLAELKGLLKIMDMHIEEMNEKQSAANNDDLLE